LLVEMQFDFSYRNRIAFIGKSNATHEAGVYSPDKNYR
jgi:hypothetical protein